MERGDDTAQGGSSTFVGATTSGLILERNPCSSSLIRKSESDRTSISKPSRYYSFVGGSDETKGEVAEGIFSLSLTLGRKQTPTFSSA